MPRAEHILRRLRSWDRSMLSPTLQMLEGVSGERLRKMLASPFFFNQRKEPLKCCWPYSRSTAEIFPEERESHVPERSHCSALKDKASIQMHENLSNRRLSQNKNNMTKVTFNTRKSTICAQWSFQHLFTTSRKSMGLWEWLLKCRRCEIPSEKSPTPIVPNKRVDHFFDVFCAKFLQLWEHFCREVMETHVLDSLRRRRKIVREFSHSRNEPERVPEN